MDLVLPMNSGAEAVENGDQSSAKMGLLSQGNPGEPSRDHRLHGQFPRQNDYSDQLFV